MLSNVAVLVSLVACTFARCVVFVVDLTWEDQNPDGGPLRKAILINGTSPGPTLYLDQGDTVAFTARNHMPFNTTIHFHGIEQNGTPWSDGVPGFSQYPIASNSFFTYRWTATQYGTYFYHAHVGGQISDGLNGPIYIRPASNVSRPFSMISNNSQDVALMEQAQQAPNLVTVADWSHYTADDVYANEAATNLDIYCTNSILVNGKGSVYCLSQAQYRQLAAPATIAALNGSNITDQGCTPPVYSEQGSYTTHPERLLPGLIYGCNATNGSQTAFIVDPTKKYASFNFISSANVETPIVSIDGHKMYVYAVDGRYIVPQQVDGLQILSGERYSVIVLLNQTPATYTMRFANLGGNQLISGFASMSYSNASPGTVGRVAPSYTYGGANTSASVVTLDKTKLPPFPATVPASSAQQTYHLRLGRTSTPYNWTLTGQTGFPVDQPISSPLLFYPNSSFALNPNYVIKTVNNTWIDIVLEVLIGSTEPTQPPHPIHKHGNKAYIIGSGTGTFNWSSVAAAMVAQPSSFNLNNPPYRDTYSTSPASGQNTWLVVRYQVANPGAWLMHCHIQNHVSGGMGLGILDGLSAFPKIPSVYAPGSNGTGGSQLYSCQT